MVNTRSEVIGMNTWKLREGEGINFAIHVNSIQTQIETIVLQLASGQLSSLSPPKQQASIPTEGVVLEYHGMGSTKTQPFNIAAGSSPGGNAMVNWQSAK